MLVFAEKKSNILILIFPHLHYSFDTLFLVFSIYLWFMFKIKGVWSCLMIDKNFNGIKIPRLLKNVRNKYD